MKTNLKTIQGIYKAMLRQIARTFIRAVPPLLSGRGAASPMRGDVPQHGGGGGQNVFCPLATEGTAIARGGTNFMTPGTHHRDRNILDLQEVQG